MDAAPLLITTRMCPLSFESRLFTIPLQMLSAHTHTLPRDGRSESSVTSWTSKKFEEPRFYHCRIVEILNLSPHSGYSYQLSIILMKVFLWLILMFTVLDPHVLMIASKREKNVIMSKAKVNMKCRGEKSDLLKSVKGFVWSYDEVYVRKGVD